MSSKPSPEFDPFFDFNAAQERPEKEPPKTKFTPRVVAIQVEDVPPKIT